jgi:hypothetical protein
LPNGVHLSARIQEEENKDQLESFNRFETCKGNECFYNKIGLAQRETLSVILGLLREFAS